MHKILRMSEVKTVTGLGRSTIYEKIAEKSFPSQISLGLKSVGWLESEVQGWIQNQIQHTTKKREMYEQ